MIVKFLLDYKGTESNPANYRKGDQAELSDDEAWTLALQGIVKFINAEPEPETEPKPKPRKK